MKPLLVDSATYIDLLRAGQDFRKLLLPAARDGMLYNCGVVRAEVIRGIRDVQTRDGITDFFDLLPEVNMTAKFWRQVTDLGWDLARLGKNPPVTDLAIAVSALHLRARLVSPDTHFDGIEGLEVLTELPPL